MKIVLAVIYLIIRLPGIAAGMIYGMTLRGFNSGVTLIDKFNDWYERDSL